MVLAEVAAWCCEFFYKACPLSLEKVYLKSFYKTVCLFQSIICGNYTDTPTHADTYKQLTIHHTSKIGKNICHIENYLDYFYKNFTSAYCNITVKLIELQEKYTASENIIDFFKVTFYGKEDTLTSLEMLPLPPEKRCYLNWCVVSDYTKYWYQEFIRAWYVLISTETESVNIPLIPDTNIGVSDWREATRKFLPNYIKVVNPKTAFISVAVIGGTLVGYYFFKSRKGKNKSKSTYFEDSNGKNLAELAEKTINDFKRFYDGRMDYLEEGIKKLKEDKQLQLDMAQLSNKFLIFEDAISNQLYNINKIIESSMKLIEKDKSQRDEYQNELNFSRSLNEKELVNLHQQMAQITAKFNALEKFVEDIENNASNQRQSEQGESTNDRQNRSKDEADETTEEQDVYVVKSLKEIKDMFKNTKELEEQIKDFKGTKEDKAYLHLKELLIRNALILDNIESEGHFIIRKERKKVLQFVHECLDVLKNKAT